MFGFDLSSFNDIISRKKSFTGSNSFKNMAKLEFFSDDIKAFSFEFNNHQQFLAEKVILKVPIKKAGICSGIMQWIQLHLTKKITFENHPKKQQQLPSGWQPAIFLFDRPVRLEKGQVLSICAEHNCQVPLFKLLSVSKKLLFPGQTTTLY